MAKDSNQTRSQLEDAIVEYAQAVAEHEESFTAYTASYREETWDLMLEAIDNHEESLYKEAHKDGKNEATEHMLAKKEIEDAGN